MSTGRATDTLLTGQYNTTSPQYHSRGEETSQPVLHTQPSNPLGWALLPRLRSKAPWFEKAAALLWVRPSKSRAGSTRPAGPAQGMSQNPRRGINPTPLRGKDIWRSSEVGADHCQRLPATLQPCHGREDTAWLLCSLPSTLLPSRNRDCREVHVKHSLC